MIRVMIADDQELIRESLSIVLSQSPDMEVMGTAKDGRALLTLLAEKGAPDVILMDIRMPEIDGVEATRLVKEKYPEAKVLVLTTFDDDEYVYGALKYGATGYLLKGVSMQELSRAVQVAAAGTAVINPDIATKVVSFFGKMAKGNLAVEVDGRAEELTRTERNIARLVGQGLSNKEVAARLSLSDGTVRNGLSGALAKLSLRDRTQLAIWAVQTGLAATSLED